MPSRLYISISLLLCFSSCSPIPRKDEMQMIQIVDRLGMNETINEKEKIQRYATTDFLSPQPFQKVVRVYQHQESQPVKMIITTYHESGMIKEYLEVKGHRANGLYQEFHDNGRLKIQAHVMEGIADLTEAAKMSFIFDGECKVYNDQGRQVALFHYSQGKLDKEACYYAADGSLEKKIPYRQDRIDGIAQRYDAAGQIIGATAYQEGVKEGRSFFLGNSTELPFEEFYHQGKLLQATYYGLSGQVLSKIVDGFGICSITENHRLIKEVEYRKGEEEGLVKTYYPSGRLYEVYTQINGQKHGDEWVYYDDDNRTPKLLLTWYQDELHGSQKSYYPNGNLESQREMVHNLMQGQLIAWYQRGDLMMMEEYEHHRLQRGVYYKIHSQEKVSEVEDGSGIATIFDGDGLFVQKVIYAKGEIIDE
jgi:antitoxin component YwqK of YwqJK toxin-antitoxin module